MRDSIFLGGGSGETQNEPQPLLSNKANRHGLIASRLGLVTQEERDQTIYDSPIGTQYDEALDRESAYEILQAREEEMAEKAEREVRQLEEEKERATRKKATRRRSSGRQSVSETAVKPGLRVAVREITRYVIRGILGGRRR